MQQKDLELNETRYNLVVTKNLEDKIRFLCNKVSNIEWSGVLFYTVEGNYQNNLKIICHDLYLKDVGNNVSTEFTTEADEVNYAVEHDLMDCFTGLIHSHHVMRTNFSGTDLNTLYTEGLDTNNFVSLIVNNQGTYSAAITRKEIRKYDIHLTRTNCFFDGNSQDSKEHTSKEITKVIYNYLDITIEKDKKLSELEQRYNEVKSKIKSNQENNKKEIKEDDNPDSFSLDISDMGNKQTSHNVSSTFLQSALNPPILFEEKDIDDILAILLTGDITVDSSKINVKVLKTDYIDKEFDQAFKYKDFSIYANSIIELLLENKNLMMKYHMEYEEFTFCMARELIERLDKLPSNKFIGTYILNLEQYM